MTVAAAQLKPPGGEIGQPYGERRFNGKWWLEIRDRRGFALASREAGLLRRSLSVSGRGTGGGSDGRSGTVEPAIDSGVRWGSAPHTAKVARHT